MTSATPYTVFVFLTVRFLFKNDGKIVHTFLFPIKVGNMPCYKKVMGKYSM